MLLTFIGADHEVTGSCHFIEAAGKNILVDYGMEQGKDYYENEPLPVSAPKSTETDRTKRERYKWKKMPKSMLQGTADLSEVPKMTAEG